MSAVHVIRLRGPWDYEVLARETEVGQADPAKPNAGRTTVPGEWTDLLGEQFLGSVRYTRAFNRPTNLEPHERVWLSLAGADHAAQVTLNGLQLGTFQGSTSEARFDVTEQLALHNRLQVDVTLSRADFDDPVRGPRRGSPGGLTGEVRLEIVNEPRLPL